jgi:hypothetical protein
MQWLMQHCGFLREDVSVRFADVISGLPGAAVRVGAVPVQACGIQLTFSELHLSCKKYIYRMFTVCLSMADQYCW